MATQDDHQKQAEHNRRFLHSINKEDYPDWAATIIFYTAVHRVQCLFQVRGGRGGSHRWRNDTLREKYPDIWKEYQPLYVFSRLSRYWCMKVKPDSVGYLERRLGRVERAIEKIVER